VTRSPIKRRVMGASRGHGRVGVLSTLAPLKSEDIG
jgi:hypothetical protein